MVNKREIAHHEAGHAVIARVLGVEVEYATLATLDGDLGQVLTRSAAHASPNDLVAYEKDAMVSLAGPLTQAGYRYQHRKASGPAWREEWNDDRRNAMNCLGMLFLRQRGESITPGEVSFEGERAEAFERLYNDTHVKTVGLIADHWPAIERVAEALRAGRLLSQANLDALIAEGR